jgi:hypothetical protein
VHRIEWEPASFKEFKETVKTLAGEMRRMITWSVSYDLLKNGLRFPSSQRINETYIGKSDRAYTVYEAKYRYLNYRFFTVRTEVRYDEP